MGVNYSSAKIGTNFTRITRCLCFPIWLCPLHLQTLWQYSYVKLTCFVTLWQTLAGTTYSLGFPLLNQSNPPFLFPTSHFLREGYWFCPWNDKIFSSIEDVSASDKQGDLGQNKISIELFCSIPKQRHILNASVPGRMLGDGNKRCIRYLLFIQRALSLVMKTDIETYNFNNTMQW